MNLWQQMTQMSMTYKNIKNNDLTKTVFYLTNNNV